MGLQVQCPQCRRVMHSTTALYDPDKTAKGNMVELLPKWKKRGWQTFYGGGGSSTPAAAMQCPHCSGRLAPSGKLRIKPEPEPVLTQAQKNQSEIAKSFEEPVRPQDKLYLCHICDREIKGIGGYTAHMNAHERRGECENG